MKFMLTNPLRNTFKLMPSYNFDFTSTFELIAAFNFAYVISSDFTKSLERQIVGSYSGIDKLLAEVKTLVRQNADYLSEKINSIGNNSNELTNLYGRKRTFDLQLNQLEDRVAQKIETSGISKTFNYYCLFAGFYSFFLLIIFGFGFSWSNNRHSELLLIFNFISLLGVIFLFDRWLIFKFFIPNYLKTIFISSATIFFLSILCWFYRNQIPVDSAGYFSMNFAYLNIFICLILPTFHFLYYFRKAFLSRREKGKEVTDEIKKFKVKCIEFSGVLKDKFEPDDYDLTQ